MKMQGGAAAPLILAVNAGSSSLKCALFDAGGTRLAEIRASEIGGAARLHAGGTDVAMPMADHRAALDAVLDRLARDGLRPADLAAAAHRVVHGGTRFGDAVRVDAGARAAIADLAALAPLHNPVALACIDALAARAPDLPQTASFDTAFHADQAEVATAYALPEEWRARGLRRYGFHGLSYQGVVAALDPLPRRLLACHLGNGASLCAIRNGRSVATTMGYTPASGLTMGTRAGDIDAMAVLAIAGEVGIDAAARLLNSESGLRALGGSSDMRALPRDGFARAHFSHWLARHAGSMLAAMGGLDAIAFTGGIGENDADIRDTLVRDLAWAEAVPVHVVPADEERQIARDAARILGMTTPVTAP